MSKTIEQEVEELAKILCDNTWPGYWDEVVESSKEAWRIKARAVLKAGYRKPSVIENTDQELEDLCAVLLKHKVNEMISNYGRLAQIIIEEGYRKPPVVEPIILTFEEERQAIELLASVCRAFMACRYTPEVFADQLYKLGYRKSPVVEAGEGVDVIKDLVKELELLKSYFEDRREVVLHINDIKRNIDMKHCDICGKLNVDCTCLMDDEPEEKEWENED